MSDKHHITIAGHTAPNKGIELRFNHFAFHRPLTINRCSHVVIRYIRIRAFRSERTPAVFLPDTRGLRVTKSSDVLLDHLSIAHVSSVGLLLWQSSRVTIQNCIIGHLIPGNNSNTIAIHLPRDGGAETHSITIRNNILFGATWGLFSGSCGLEVINNVFLGTQQNWAMFSGWFFYVSRLILNSIFLFFLCF